MMPRLPLLGDALSRFLDVNARYCAALGRVTADFLSELVGALEVPPRVGEETRRNPPNGARRPPYEAAQPARPPAQDPAMQQAIILLEAEADHTAMGVFLVANHLDHEILVRPQASPFYDPPGTTSVPRVVFDPEVVSLAPRERILVKIVASVDRSLQPEVRYRCEVSVPTLADTRIPVVIRRRPDRPKAEETGKSPAAEARQAESATSTVSSEETLAAEPKPARRSARPGERSRKRKKRAAPVARPKED